MLSAVAARKARLQQNASSPKAVQVTEPSSQPSPEPADVEERVKPPSKRKSSTPAPPAPKPAKKKRKVNKAADKKTPRYFAEKDGFREQDDVIVVEDDEDEGESSSSGESSDERIPSLRQPGAVPKARTRAWSPSVPLQDSSDEEEADATLDEALLNPPAVSRPAEEPPQILSTFRPIQDQNLFNVTPDELHSLGVVNSSVSKLLVLRPSDRLALLGTYSLTVLRGAVSLNGIQLTPSLHTHRIFAPRSSPIPVIEYTTARQEDKSAISLPSRFAGVAVPGNAVILLQELRTGVEGLGRVCRTFEDVFTPTRWQKTQSTVDLGLQGVHYVTYSSPDSQPFLLPASWVRSLDATCAESGDSESTDLSRRVFVVHGVKKTGKSTFARTLVNRLLTKYKQVAFLECDLGQSEFTPGGMIALNILDQPVFGPPFTHPSIPHHAHYIGSTTPRNCPSQYLEAISALVQTYNIDVQYAGQLDAHDDDGRIADLMPLVVNMMGWTKGLGADLSRKILDIAQPSAIFDFEAPQPENGWPQHRNADYPDTTAAFDFGMDGLVTRHSLEAIPAQAMSHRYTPADQRILSILSYFHAVFPPSPPLLLHPDSIYASSWDTSLPLCAQQPYELSSDSALDAVVLCGPGSEDVVSSEVHHVLNGAVVGLVSCEPGALDLDGHESTSTTRGIPYMQGMPPPPPSVSNCHGLALIRSVSSDTPAKLHLLTPLPPAHLVSTQPRVIVKGEMELPVWGMLDFRTEDAVAGVEKSKVPFLRWGKTEGTGGERRRVRRNLMRRGQQ